MNIITQNAMKRQLVVEYALKNGKSKASRKYGVSLSSVKRWCKRFDGTQESLKANHTDRKATLNNIQKQRKS